MPVPVQLARIGLVAAVFLTSSSVLLLTTALRPGTAEFVVTAITCGLGVFLGLISISVFYLERRRS